MKADHHGGQVLKQQHTVLSTRTSPEGGPRTSGQGRCLNQNLTFVPSFLFPLISPESWNVNTLNAFAIQTIFHLRPVRNGAFENLALLFKLNVSCELTKAIILTNQKQEKQQQCQTQQPILYIQTACKYAIMVIESSLFSNEILTDLIRRHKMMSKLMSFSCTVLPGKSNYEYNQLNEVYQ